MPAAVNLPIELILLATEYAAWDDLNAQSSDKAIRRWRQWAASLCTVCRAFEPTMARILYTLVYVHLGNLDAVLRAAGMDTHPFRRARAVYFDTRRMTLARELCAVGAAFQHVHACTGSFDDLRPLFDERIYSHDLRPLSVHFTLPHDAFYLNHFPTVTFLAERLHLIFDSPKLLSNDDLSRFRTRFLILDVHAATVDDAMDRLGQVLGAQTLERILVRPYAPWNRILAQILRDRVRSVAETQRSTAIWFDESFPAYHGSVPISTPELHRYRYLSDAMLGDDLWLRGSQLYVPRTDTSLRVETL